MNKISNSKEPASDERPPLIHQDDELGDFMPKRAAILAVAVATAEQIPERRTLIRRRADQHQAGVLRGEVSTYMGEVIEVEMKPADPNCRWCGGLGYYTGGDEHHVCWCRRD